MVHRVGPHRRGRRYSLDVNADNSYGAAHLYLTHVKGHPGCGMPIPTTETTFEVVTEGRIHSSRRVAFIKSPAPVEDVD